LDLIEIVQRQPLENPIHLHEFVAHQRLIARKSLASVGTFVLRPADRGNDQDEHGHKRGGKNESLHRFCSNPGSAVT
jgi:hypothetical protein